MTPRHRQALALRSEGHTWEYIGLRLGVSRQRAQQLGTGAAPSKPGRRPSPLRQRARELATSMTHAEVAERLGVSRSMVTKAASPKPRYSETLDKEIRNLRANGLKWREIAERLGVGHSRVRAGLMRS